MFSSVYAKLVSSQAYKAADHAAAWFHHFYIIS